MRIAAISDPDLVNSNYRAYQPLMALERRGHEITLNRAGEPRFRVPTLVAADAVLIHRYFDAEIQQLVRHLNAAGVGVVWDNDDDVTAVPRSNPQYARFRSVGLERIRAEQARMIRLADVVTTPSAVLAERFAGAGASEVRLLENYLPREFGGARKAKHDGIVIAWLAALEHQGDYQQLRLRETFERLLDADADLRIMSIGLNLGLRTDRYEHHPLVPFLELVQVLARADVGIAPLADIPWNQARSNVKLKEYGAAGLAWLASPVAPYASLGEAEGGALVPDDGWHQAISRLVVDARGRRKLAKRAAKWAKGEGIERHVQLWEAALGEAHRRARR